MANQKMANQADWAWLWARSSALHPHPPAQGAQSDSSLPTWPGSLHQPLPRAGAAAPWPSPAQPKPRNVLATLQATRKPLCLGCP